MSSEVGFVTYGIRSGAFRIIGRFILFTTVCCFWFSGKKASSKTSFEFSGFLPVTGNAKKAKREIKDVVLKKAKEITHDLECIKRKECQLEEPGITSSLSHSSRQRRQTSDQESYEVHVQLTYSGVTVVGNEIGKLMGELSFIEKL